MNDKQVTSVVYADNYNVTIGNEVKPVDIVEEYGGYLYSKTDNLIVIAPSVGSVTVQTEPEINAVGSFKNAGRTEVVLQNITSTLFHEIGERNTPAHIYQRGVAIDYENHVRKILGMPHRPYDVHGHYKNLNTAVK